MSYNKWCMPVISEKIRQRTLSQPSEFSGKHLLATRTLKEGIDIAIVAAQTPEDLDIELKEQADEEYRQALRDNESLGSYPTIRSRVKFMQTNLGLDTEETARLLGITANQVARKDFRARRKEEIGKFESRLNNGVAITNILMKENPATVFNRRDAIRRSNGKIIDYSIFKVMEAGFGNIAVSLAQEHTIKHNQEVMGYQRG